MTQNLTRHSLSAPAFGKWRWLCLALAWVATLGLVALPLINSVMILFPEAMSFPIKIRDTLVITDAIGMPYRLGILACALIPIGIGMWGMWSLRQLFLDFSRGQVFTARALRHLNHIALALLLGEIADFLVLAPQSLLASWPHGAGHREISLGGSPDDLGSLFLAGVAFIIVRVMAEAQRIAADHAEIV